MRDEYNHFRVVRNDEGTLDQIPIASERDVTDWLAAVASLPEGDIVTLNERVRIFARSAFYHFRDLREANNRLRKQTNEFEQAFIGFCHCDPNPEIDGRREDCILHGLPATAAARLREQLGG